MANAVIRQEINILDAILAAASGASATSNEIVRLDTSQYTGPTYYFEVIAQSTVSLAFTVTLVGSTDGTVATVNVPTLTTAYTRLRSSSFTPTTAAQNYTVVISNAVGATKNCKAARIIIIQSAASITATETQIEIGNADNTISLTDVPLTNPKYWTYTASKWSPTPTAYFEATFKSGTTKSVSTMTLQVDDGAFGGWANVSGTAIVTTTTTNPERIRSGAFTLTDGRHYRCVMKAGNTKSGLVLYNAKVILQQSPWVLVGSGLTISGIDAPALAAMSSTRVAFMDDTLDSLRAYDFDGSAWALVGSALAITTPAIPALAAMSSTQVAFIDTSNEALRAYNFNGSVWSLVGSGFSYAPIGNPALAALSSTRIALIDDGTQNLIVLDFNGSTWSSAGIGLNIPGIGPPALAAMSSTRVAFIDSTLEVLQAYDINGSTWDLVGSGLTVTGITRPALAALSSTRVAYIDGTLESLRVYEFSGSTWAQVGTGTPISGIGLVALAMLSSTRVAFIDDLLESLRTYDLSVSGLQCEPQYLLLNTQDAGTGLQAYQTLWSSAEWSDSQGGLPTFTYSHDASNAADSSKLRDITAGADVSGATVTGANQQISAAFTMPTTGDELDTNVTVSTGVVAAVRILAAWKLVPFIAVCQSAMMPRVRDEVVGY